MPRESNRRERDERDDDRGGRGRVADRDDDRGGRGDRDGGGRRKFGYRTRSAEDVDRWSKQSSSRYDNILTEDLPWFKSRDGENQIRIMPWLSTYDPEFDALDQKWGNHWGIRLTVHRNVGPDKGTYLCLDKMKGEPCPMCDLWREEQNDDLKPSDRVLAWLVDRNNEKQGPCLWNMPLGTSNDIGLASKIKKTGEVLLIDDPSEGYDVFFDKQGEKKLTKYKNPTVDREPSYLAENEKTQDKWLDFVMEKRLPDLLKYYEVDYLEKLLAGQVVRDDDDDGEDGGRERTSRRGGGRDRDRDRDSDSRDDSSDRGRGSRRGDRDRGRDREDDRGGSDEEAESFSRSSRRGRGGEDDARGDRDEDAGGRGSRRGDRGDRDPEDGDEDEGGSRPSRRGRGRGEEAGERGRGRGGDETTGDADPPFEGGRRRSERGSSRGEGTESGETERYRPRGEPEGETSGDVADAKDKLRGVGSRRSRR